MIIFLSLVLLAAKLVASSISFNSHVRNVILDVLRNFHHQNSFNTTASLQIRLPAENNTKDNSKEFSTISRNQRNLALLEELGFEIFEYLDVKSIYNFMLSNLKFFEIGKVFINRKLYIFCPYLLTNYNSFNLSLFSILKQHFKESTTVYDSTVHDELQLLTLKFYFNEGDEFKGMNKTLFYYFLCLFHESIYGIGFSPPTSREDCKVKLVRNLRLYDLPKSYNFIMNLKSKTLFDSFSTVNKSFQWKLRNWKRTLKFFYNRPSEEDIDQFILDHGYFQEIHHNPIPDEFKVAILEIKESSIDESCHFQSMCYLSHHNSYSQIMFNRYMQTDPDLDSDYNNSMIIRDFRFTEAIEKELHNSENRRALNYILTRNTINRFNPSDTLSFDVHDIVTGMVELILSTSYSLSQIEMFSEFIRSQNNPKILKFLLSKIFSYSCHVLLEVILDETMIPLSLFIYESYGKITSLMSKQFQPNMIFFETFIDRVMTSESIVLLLFIHPNHLKILEPLIKDRFNLNICYHFNLDVEKIYKTIFDSEKAKNLFDRIISFVDLLKFFGLESLLNIFTSDPSRWNNVDCHNFPLISIKHLIQPF